MEKERKDLILPTHASISTSDAYLLENNQEEEIQKAKGENKFNSESDLA
jgi:hypothetical protein